MSQWGMAFILLYVMPAGVCLFFMCYLNIIPLNILPDSVPSFRAEK